MMQLWLTYNRKPGASRWLSWGQRNGGRWFRVGGLLVSWRAS